MRGAFSTQVISGVSLLLLLTTSTSARDVFVNNETGDDRNEGFAAVPRGEGSGPCRTIAKALRLAESGDRIVLAKTDEPYRESITVQAGPNSGVRTKPFVIEGNGAILDGRQVVPPDGWEHVGGELFRFHPPRTSYQLLFLDDKPAVQRKLTAQANALPKLQPLETCLFDRYIYFRTEPGKGPPDYELSYTALPVGITLYEVRHVIINDLVVQGFQLDGVNAHDSAFDVSLNGLTCRGNGRSGISIGGASRVTLEACLVGNNGAAQVRTEGQSHTRIVNCNLLDNTAPALQRDGGKVTVEKDEGEQAAAAPRATLFR